MDQNKQIKEVEKIGTFGQMKRFISDNALQVIFVVGLVIWTITSVIRSLIDLVSLNFDNKILSFSFIVCLVTGSYLATQRYIKKRAEKPKKETCEKCGKKNKKSKK